VDAERRSPLAVTLTVLSWTVLILFAALEIFPFVFTVANSFKCLPAVQTYPRSIIPVPPFGVECTYQDGERAGASRSPSETSGAATFNPTLEGYREILDANLPRWLVNTGFFAVAVTILRLAFDSLAGYALARLKFPGNRLLFFTILGTMMVPPIVLLILDNETTAMTGHQGHPATGWNVRREESPRVSLEALVSACGVTRLAVVDPGDMKALEKAVGEALKPGDGRKKT